MTALTPAVQIALGVFSAATEMMAAVRIADEAIKAEGEGENPDVLRIKRRLAAEILVSSDAFRADLEAERQRRRGLTSEPEQPVAQTTPDED